MKKLLLLVLAGVAALPAAQAQTGRIAQGSHAGRVAGSAAANDNLGLRTITEWRQDSLVCVSRLRLEHRGEVRSWHNDVERERATWRRQVQVYEYEGSPKLAKEEIRHMRQFYPNAVFLDFAQARKLKSRAPAGHTQTFCKRSLPYSYWRELATVVVLGAVGWRLGCKAKTV